MPSTCCKLDGCDLRDRMYLSHILFEQGGVPALQVERDLQSLIRGSGGLKPGIENLVGGDAAEWKASERWRNERHAPGA